MRRTYSRLWAFAPLISLAAWAQEAPPADGAPAQAPKASTPAASKGPAGKAPEATLKAVEIRANQESDTRRLSTAAKIVVGREEIERYGDTSMGELLKRLPGVVSGGRPGRGGPPQMRGLGGGYTQILIDGERAPRGFSLEDLAPEQVERGEPRVPPRRREHEGGRGVGGVGHDGGVRGAGHGGLAGLQGGAVDGDDAAWAAADDSADNFLGEEADTDAATVGSFGASAADRLAKAVGGKALLPMHALELLMRSELKEGLDAAPSSANFLGVNLDAATGDGTPGRASRKEIGRAHV